MYDVIIVGAGPAGATLARIIGNRYKVLLVDKRFHPGTESSRDKCCGGLLAPDAQKILGKMGVALTREILVSPQIFKVRAIDLQAGLEKYYQRFYINLDRAKFDRWLVSMVPTTVETRFGRRLIEIEHGNRYRVHLYGEKGTETIEGKVLVGADGAYSMVRRKLFPSAVEPRLYLAFQEWFSADQMLPYYSAIFEPSITDFYSWVIPKERFLIVGSALSPGKNASQKFLKLKEQLGNYGYRLGESVKQESAALLRPGGTRDIQTGAGQAILIGEAAGLISPSSAEGLSYAFVSALLASKALSDGLHDPALRYHRMTVSLRSNIKRKRIKSSIIYCAPTRRAIMTSGFFTIKLDDG